jgi:hypothetical protein
MNVTSAKDRFGNTIQFDAVAVHGANNEYPKWSFSRSTQSGLLDVPSSEDLDHVSLCAYPPNVTLKVKKLINWLGETPLAVAPHFAVTVSCVKAPGPGGTNFASPTSVNLADGEIGTITAPAGTVCTATDADPGFVTTPNTVNVPVPTQANPTPPVPMATVTNTRKRTLTITKSVVYPPGWAALATDPTQFAFAVVCNGVPVVGSPFSLAAAGSTAVLVRHRCRRPPRPSS